MVQVLEQEQDAMPEAIEATLNYLMDTGEPVFTQTAAPGGLDVRSGGRQDPRHVTIRNGRLRVGQFALEQDGFRLVRHDTKVRDFFDENEVSSVYYPEMETLVKAESGAAQVVVFDHTLRTRMTSCARSAEFVRSSAACTTTIQSGPARSVCAICFPAKPMSFCAGDLQSCRCGVRFDYRSRALHSRSVRRVAFRRAISSYPSAAIRTGSARPTP